MQAIVRHATLKAEGLGDIEGTVAVYTRRHRSMSRWVFFRVARATARMAPQFYEHLTATFRAEERGSSASVRDRRRDGPRAADDRENHHRSMLGIPGNGRRISFRILHVFGVPRRVDQP